MKNRVVYIFAMLILVVFGCKDQNQVNKQVDFYETQLFKDVQLAEIFEDSKTFVDLVPQEHPADLEAKYLDAKDQEDFDLATFVNENFKDQSMESLAFETDSTKSMYEHINSMWDKLKRGPDSIVPHSSRIALPHKYIVPGGRFQEIYYWDSYFTMVGLLEADRDDLAKNMVDNFSYLIDSFGFIPNGTRDYYKGRSQPPFYAMMVDALAQKDEKMYLYYLPEMVKEYEFWMDGTESVVQVRPQKHVVDMGNNIYLNRYWDTEITPRPESYKEDFHMGQELANDSLRKLLYRNLRAGAASGWDFSSRWYGEAGDFGSTETTEILPVDLNCLLFFLESSISKAARMKGDREAQKRFRDISNKRRGAIQNYLWNEESGFFQDYNFKDEKSTSELTLAGAFPLYFGLANRDQAEKVKNVLVDKFLKEGGLVTTLVHSGQQWDAPNGWAPLQWIAVRGLIRYGYVDEAKEIMTRWLALNEKVYQDTGKMMEKYNVEDLTLLSGGGEYETQDGFGWTNGVALGFKGMLQQLDTIARTK